VEAINLTTVRKRNGKIISNHWNRPLRGDQNWAFNQILSRQDDWTKIVGEWISHNTLQKRREGFFSQGIGTAAWVLLKMPDWLKA